MFHPQAENGQVGVGHPAVMLTAATAEMAAMPVHLQDSTTAVMWVAGVAMEGWDTVVEAVHRVMLTLHLDTGVLPAGPAGVGAASVGMGATEGMATTEATLVGAVRLRSVRAATNR